jgi:nucleoside 2-deoxyribosyltransferase
MQGSLTNVGIHDQSYRAAIGVAIKACFADAEIIDPIELHPDAGLSYGPEKARQTLLDMTEEAAQADVLIAYLPQASMGTAVEMWQAYRAGKPVLTISPLAENWVVRFLSTRVFPSLEDFEAFVVEGELEKLLEGWEFGKLVSLS